MTHGLTVSRSADGKGFTENVSGIKIDVEDDGTVNLTGCSLKDMRRDDPYYHITLPGPLIIRIINALIERAEQARDVIAAMTRKENP